MEKSQNLLSFKKNFVKSIIACLLALKVHTSVEKYRKTRLQFLRKNQHFFRQINVFTKEVTNELISRNFLSVIAFYSTFPHSEVR